VAGVARQLRGMWGGRKWLPDLGPENGESTALEILLENPKWGRRRGRGLRGGGGEERRRKRRGRGVRRGVGGGEGAGKGGG